MNGHKGKNLKKLFLLILMICVWNVDLVLGDMSADDKKTAVLTMELLNQSKEFKKTSIPSRKSKLNLIKNVIEKRKVMLLHLMKDNPQAARTQLLSDKELAQLPLEIKTLVETKTVGEGIFTVVIEENINGKESQLRYELKDIKTKKRHALHFVKEPPSFKTGAIIKIHGYKISEDYLLDTGKISAKSDSSASMELIQLPPPPPMSNVKTAIIITNFQDAQVSCLKNNIDNDIFLSSNSMNNFYKESSYNQTEFIGEVFGPITIPYTSTSSCDYNVWGDTAYIAAINAGIDLNSFDKILYIMPRNNNCPFAGVAYIGGRYAWNVGYCSARSLNAHEIGHTLGMYHASTVNQEYGDLSDVMGGGAEHHPNSAHKIQMGWVTGPQVLDISALGEYNVHIENLESPSTSLKVVRIPKPNSNENYYFSFRRAVGFDLDLGSNYKNQTNIHRKGTTNTFYLTSINNGQSFNDPINGITVTQLAHDELGADLHIQIAQVFCSKTNPTIVVSPISPTVLSGQNINYFVTITNNNSPICPAEDFHFVQHLPLGLSGTISPDHLGLTSGQTSYATWTVSPPAGTALGSYPLNLEVINSSMNQYRADADVTLKISQEENIQPLVFNFALPIYKFALSGNNLYFISTHDQITDVYRYDFTTHTQSKIFTNPVAFYSFSISGDKMVWLEYPQQGPGGGGTPQIYLYNLNSNTKSQITPDTNLAYKTLPVISGNHIAWTDNRSSDFQIYGYDLADTVQPEKQITSGNSQKSNLVIDGNTMAWIENNSDIFVYDLISQSKPTQLLLSNSNKSELSISGPYLIWIETNNSQQDIYLYDTNLHMLKQITSNAEFEFMPSISGNNIVWADGRDGNNNIFLYDLELNQERQITIDQSSQQSPLVYGRRIIWEDYRNGNSDLYGYEIPTPYQIWKSQKFLVADLNNSQVSGPNADPDNDNIINLFEYAYNFTPISYPIGSSRDVNPFRFYLLNNRFTIEYRKNTKATDLQYRVTVKSNLTDPTWQDMPHNVTYPRIQTIDSSTQFITDQDTVDVTTPNTMRFFRLEVTLTGFPAMNFNLAPSLSNMYYSLNVTKNGSGSISSTHINCGQTCSFDGVNGTREILTAQPATGYQFDGWSGDCSGKANCEITFNTPKTVQASFSPVPPSSGDALVPLCYRCRTISVPFYLRTRYIANGATDGVCSSTCGTL